MQSRKFLYRPFQFLHHDKTNFQPDAECCDDFISQHEATGKIEEYDEFWDNPIDFIDVHPNTALDQS